ncbi:helix-turn-helix domain-containing protein [Fodinibius salsisoli]|uniref:Helix-turn-helix transcriptional regulator n=1 Tax=Fodinibius salsisoli TaxID=2820877 RepID=A0ABT3PLK6_9BACT|nr:helix-turn-helix transcriptional regulator [Fodinibius salsisoli]MCW9706833.1 helix-turn-helix transcriptional regulator [Fodinibius salsisoli]
MLSTEFGNNLKKIRKNRGYNQQEVAEKMEMTQASISQFEKGNRVPTPSLIRKFANILDANVEEFVGSSDAEFERQMLMRNVEDLSADSIKKINEFVELIKSGNK